MFHRFSFRIVLIVGFLMAAEGVSILAPMSPSPCLLQTTQNEQAALHYNKDSCPTFLSGSWILLSRLEHFFETHDKAIVASFTIVLAISTIGLWFATAKLWRSTNDTLQHAEKTAERQLRAYIGVSSMDLKVYPFEPGEFAFIAHIEMKNFGQTPAYDMSIWSDVKIDAFDAIPFDMTKEPAQPQKAGIVFPGTAFNVDRGLKISTADKDALYNREKTVFFWGTIRYTDAFKHRRYFSFRTLSSGQIVVGTGGTYVVLPHPLGYDAD